MPVGVLLTGGPLNTDWWSNWPQTSSVIQVSPSSSEYEIGGQVTVASMSFANTRPESWSTHTNGSSDATCCTGDFSSHVLPPSFERATPGSALVLRAERN